MFFPLPMKFLNPEFFHISAFWEWMVVLKKIAIANQYVSKIHYVLDFVF